MFLIDKSFCPLPETEAEPYTLDSLIAWLRTMPADRSYQWECTNGMCLIGQYCAAQGNTQRYFLQVMRFEEVAGFCYPYGRAIKFPIAVHVAVAQPRTFGAALERALRVRNAAA